MSTLYPSRKPHTTKTKALIDGAAWLPEKTSDESLKVVEDVAKNFAALLTDAWIGGCCGPPFLLITHIENEIV